MNVRFALLAFAAALLPVAAIAETQTLDCTVGGKPMTLTYEGDDMTGTLTAKTPWGDMTIPDVIYAGGSPAGEFSFLSLSAQPAVVMPDMAKLEACIKGMTKSPGELMDITTLQINTEACVPKIADGKPVPATVEINVGVSQEYGVDVDVYRTYTAESPVAEGNIVVLLPQDQQPICKVTTPQ